MKDSRQNRLGIHDDGFLSYSHEELRKFQYNAFDLENKKGYFRIEHQNEDGTTEICRVESSEDQDGYKIWSLGAYTTKSGAMYLAVVGAKVLPHVKIVKHGNCKTK